MLCQELDIYIYDALDNRYGFSMSVQPEIDLHHFSVSFHELFEKKVLRFSKVGRSVIGWRNG